MVSFTVFWSLVGAGTLVLFVGRLVKRAGRRPVPSNGSAR